MVNYKINYKQALSELKKRIYPVYVLMGEERAEKDEFVDRLYKGMVEGVKEKSGNVERIVLFGDDVDPGEVISEIETFSFFGDGKLVVVKGADPMLNNSYVLDYIENPNDESVLVLYSEKKNEKEIPQKLKKFSGKSVRIIIFWKNFQDDFERWVFSELKSAGINSDRDVVRYIVENTGGQKEEIRRQINLISNFLENGEKLSLEKIEKILSVTVDYSVFDLLNSIYFKNSTMLVKMYRTLVNNREDLSRIIFLMWNYFKKIMLAKSLYDQKYTINEIREQLGIKPNSLEFRRISKIISNVDMKELKSVVRMLEKVDLTLKTSPRLLADIAFEKLLYRFKVITGG